LSISVFVYLVIFAANSFALTKLTSMGWQNVGISLKIKPVKQINVYYKFKLN